MQWRISTIILSFLFLLSFHSAQAYDVTLREKIGQMVMIGFKGTELTPDDAIVKAILAQEVGGVILFDRDFKTKTYDRNIKNPAQVKRLTQQLQDYAKKAAQKNKNNLIPLLIGIDYEGGKVNRLKESYGFPNTLSAAEIAELPEKEIREHANQMAKTLSDAGINLNFAPVLDVNINPDNPVIGKLSRSFSANPQTVTYDAALFSKAYKSHGILCAYKHFPGHGSSTGDTHEGFVDVTDTWKEEELIPYKKLISQKNSCEMVMTAHVVNRKLDKKAYPASLSQAMTTNLLRKKLNFNGIVITDDLQMKAIADHYPLADTIQLAVNAGADILVFGNQLTIETPQDPKQVIDIIYDAVKTGKISKKRIDESYQRIMRLKTNI